MSPSQRNPILDIPESFDPEEMNWVHGVVQFDDPKMIEPKQEGWNESYMYGLKSNNVDHVMFASPTMHKKIQDTGAIKDTVIKLGRMGQKTETRWFAKYVSGPQRSENGKEEDFRDDDNPYQPPARPASPPKPNGQPQSPSPQPVSHTKNGYPVLNSAGLKVLDRVLEDTDKVYWLAYDRVKNNERTKDWDEDRIGATATGLVISLGNQLRSMVGGWNARSDYGQFNDWTVLSSVGVAAPKEEEEPFVEPDDKRWPRIKNLKATGESLTFAIAAMDDRIAAPNHAQAILNRFGYSTAGIDPMVHWQMAQMVWMYKDITEQDGSKNEALKVTAEVFSHPQDMVNWYDEDPPTEERQDPVPAVEPVVELDEDDNDMSF